MRCWKCPTGRLPSQALWCTAGGRGEVEAMKVEEEVERGKEVVEEEKISTSLVNQPLVRLSTCLQRTSPRCKSHTVQCHPVQIHSYILAARHGRTHRMSIYVEDITLLDKLGSTKNKQILPDSNRCLFSPPSFQLWISPPASCARVLVPLLAWAPKIASHWSCATLWTAMHSYKERRQKNW